MKLNIVNPDGTALLEEIFRAIDNAGGMTQPRPAEVKGWPVEARRALLERDALRCSNDNLRAEVERLEDKVLRTQDECACHGIEQHAEVERLKERTAAAEEVAEARAVELKEE
jgi:hypothetical protein